MASTWAATANNETVSRNALSNAIANGIFVLKNSFTADVKQITKAEADSYVYIDTSYAPFAAKANNQLVIKTDLEPPPYYYYSGILCGGGISVNFRSPISNLDSLGVIVEAWCASCGGGSVQCFDNISPNAPSNTNDVIATHSSCAICYGQTTTTTTTTTSPATTTTTTTTTTAPSTTTTTTTTTAPTVYSFNGCGVSDTSQLNACADAGSNPKTLYSTCATLSVGCVLYLDSGLVTPVTQVYVKADGSNWDMDGGGLILAFSSTQC